MTTPHLPHASGVPVSEYSHQHVVPVAAVYLDGKRLQMGVDENEQEHIMGLESGELMLLWELNRLDVGTSVEITTGTLTTGPPLSRAELEAQAKL